MKAVHVLLALMSLVLQTPAQTANDSNGIGEVTDVPFPLLINGSGRVYTFHDEPLVEGGRRYIMFAVPERGFTFTNWNLVNVFTFTEIIVDPSDNTITNSSTVVSPVPKYIRGPLLGFTMPPAEVIYDVPGVRTITESEGWQANFVPVRRRAK